MQVVLTACGCAQQRYHLIMAAPESWQCVPVDSEDAEGEPMLNFDPDSDESSANERFVAAVLFTPPAWRSS